ncbi:hypothetical protein L3i22_028300 [Actinoplanes sp. L3-i22]|nr:hypothetical protein L3i22_028300 [Actinoplanes sp. L3-i22]
MAYARRLTGPGVQYGRRRTPGGGIIIRVTNWEYARLEYRAAGTLGTDRFMDWTATFHHPGGVLRWGTDERFDDLRHMNRAGAAGWQAYDRAVIHVKDEPHRLSSVTYSMRRPIPTDGPG